MIQKVIKQINTNLNRSMCESSQPADTRIGDGTTARIHRTDSLQTTNSHSNHHHGQMGPKHHSHTAITAMDI